MNTRSEYGGNSGFLIGLITGAVVGGVAGAGIAIALAPRLAAELRQRVKKSADDVSHAASQGYQEMDAGIAAVVDVATAKGQAIRDNVADAVGRGAREVERFAMGAKTIPERGR